FLGGTIGGGTDGVCRVGHPMGGAERLPRGGAGGDDPAAGPQRISRAAAVLSNSSFVDPMNAPRLRKMIVAVAVAALFVHATNAPAEDSAALPAGLDASVVRATDYLAKQQNADGSFGPGEFKVAVSGLSVMAFLACGHTPGAGRYGLVVRNGVDFLLAQSQPDGYYGKLHDKGM